jgi:hypothetical protein
MESAHTASLSDLASELAKADAALLLGLSAKESRMWAAYRRRLFAEIKRRTPAPRVSDATLMAELSDFA